MKRFSRINALAGLLALGAATSGVTSPVLAQTEEAAAVETDPVAEATAFARDLTASATAALTKEGASEAERLDAFQAVLLDGLALDVIGRFALGDSRKTMTDEQTARYEAIFPDYITKQYAEQFQEIIGKELEVIDAKALGARDVVVRTQFARTEGAPINVDWRIRKLKSGDQKAIDIIVSGVSIMLVKREEFSGFISQNGVDALIDRLEAEAAG
jgi:ABC-type transporter MlaC component